MPGRWQGSRRREQLPANWAAIRQIIIIRDRGRCRWIENNGRCPAVGTDVDDPDDPDDHSPSNLRLLCSAHHDRRSSAQGNEAKRARAVRNVEAHPGYS